MDYSFDIEHASKYGVDEAIVIKTLAFWLAKNKTDGRNCFEGRAWTFNTVEAWSAHFPFWTPKQMRRVLESLIDKGVLVTGTFNKRAMDRTLWYAFQDESIFLPGQINLTKWANESAQMGTALPVTTPVTTPDREPDLFTDQPKTAKTDLSTQVLDYLNTKTGKKPGRGFDSVKGTGFAGHVKSGKTFEDFKAVIDFKVSKWLTDPKMSPYLRPSTLFGSHFTEYLIEADGTANSTPLFGNDDAERFIDPLKDRINLRRQN